MLLIARQRNQEHPHAAARLQPCAGAIGAQPDRHPHDPSSRYVPKQQLAAPIIAAHSSGETICAAAIGRIIEMPRATVQRKLQELIRQGYVQQMGRGYCLTDRANVSRIGEALKTGRHLITAANRS